MKKSFHKQISTSQGMSNKIMIIQLKAPVVEIKMRDYKSWDQMPLRYTLMKRKIDIRTFREIVR